MKHALTCSVAGLLSGLVAGTAGAEQFSAAHYLPPTHPLAIASFDQWATRVDAETAGAITFEVFGGGSLYPATSALTATADGLAQVGFAVANYTPSELPATASLGDVGFAHPDFFVLAAAMSDFLINDQQVRSEWRNGGVVATSGYSTPEYYFICSKPVSTLADLAGKKIRTPTSGYGRLASALGAVSVSIPSNEIYTAMERGALDCTVGDPSFLTGSVQILEVVKGMLMMEMTPTFTGALHIYDEDFWQGRTDEQRRALLNAEAFAVANGLVQYGVEREKGLQAARDKLEMTQPGDDLKAALAKFITDNQPAQVQAANDLKVEQPEALLKRFDEYAVKWEGLMAGLKDRSDVAALEALLRENIYDKVDVKTFGMD